jgi:hypothetical protein
MRAESSERPQAAGEVCSFANKRCAVTSNRRTDQLCGEMEGSLIFSRPSIASTAFRPERKIG